MEPDVGQLLQGGGLLAFAAAVWYQVREVQKAQGRLLELLARIDERLLALLEASSPGATLQRLPPAPRRRVRTNPLGVPTARAHERGSRTKPDTDDPTEPG